MDYTFTGSGTLSAFGCADADADFIYSFKYAIGSKVYVRQSAIKGELDAVVIRKVRFIQNIATCGLLIAMYTDSLNGLYNESDLVTEADARTIVTNYLNRKIADIDAVLKSYHCT